MPRVSVVIPSYNHKNYVAEAIQSVLDQTYQDFEIVITDDGSMDGTVEIIKRFTDPRIRLFCFDGNQGACVAINNCISHAAGEYISVLNSDDIFFPDKLEKQVNFLDINKEIGAVFGYAQVIDEEGGDFNDMAHPYSNAFKQKNRVRFEWLNHFFWHGNALCHPSALIRRECYENLGLYNECLAQLPDFDFWIRLCMKYDIHIIPENLIKFRIRSHEANASADKPETRVRSNTEYVVVLKNYLGIREKEDFFRIFPEACLYEDSYEEGFIPFYISMLALKGRSIRHNNFAIFALFDFMKKPDNRKIVCEKYGFSPRDFISKTGEYDLFNSESLKSRSAELQAKMVELQLVAEQLNERKMDLDLIRSSLAWQLIQKYRCFIVYMFPARTRRNFLYARIKKDRNGFQ